ncbi:acetyl-CoA carboxylase biotin carboxylase subunit [Rapidithrix thailandica]|uniref:Acetyl-CoA carboxylase biotin carboxylase subunit n=1 Tax=Rapidithrix thailandica TaxID=413964 RepID=A0AAW9S5S4_9BACT
MTVQKIQRLLIANRGEIACRIIKSAKEMGIQTIAVFSEADRKAPHVFMADEAVCIGPPASSQSYLCQDKILQVCQELEIDAIHPGYGFLSENAEFAKKVEAAGLIFVGPSASAIETMGSKLAAKEAVKKYKIPLVPGTDFSIEDPALAKEKAREIGYPVLIKASAGGGGKGMRAVYSEEELEEQMDRAMSEARSAFGNSSVFIEKYITSPKHIEVQVLGDKHGNIVHLFERECSVQRRHQKVIEEAPSTVISPEMRQQMGDAAVGVAKACQYVGAGTVEFIVDKELNFYFLEMNTRLQVEHPITEQITGKDLVKEQLRIAQGEKLPFTQADLLINGHAIEVRIYAEDPHNNFLPDTGVLEVYKRPFGPGVRLDDGYEEGLEIPVFYDPMIAKLISFGKDREEAIQRMLRAMEEYHITGVSTTMDFCKFVLQHEIFKNGSYDTNFVAEHFRPEMLQNGSQEDKWVAAALVHSFFQEQKSNHKPDALATKEQKSKWKQRLK